MHEIDRVLHWPYFGNDELLWYDGFRTEARVSTTTEL